jgi:periplasmic divalent cation tolerance protein
MSEPDSSAAEPAIIQVITTVGSEADAQRLAEHLIARRLAACVQIDAAIQSVYGWKGEICRDPEWRVVVKTSAPHWDAVGRAIAEVHPYELPELIGHPLPLVSPAYRQWVVQQVAGPTTN